MSQKEMFELLEFIINFDRELEHSPITLSEFTSAEIIDEFQKYKEINKDYHKNYKENNKDKIKKQQKENNEKNKIVKYNCVCGSNLRLADKKRHLKTTKHLNYIRLYFNILRMNKKFNLKDKIIQNKTK